jgi:hypothetical protein
VKPIGQQFVFDAPPHGTLMMKRAFVNSVGWFRADRPAVGEISVRPCACRTVFNSRQTEPARLGGISGIGQLGTAGDETHDRLGDSLTTPASHRA